MSPCHQCGADGTLQCSVCETGSYCSQKCYSISWPLHKSLCETFKDFQDPPPAKNGGENYVRAIYFHPEEAVARFVWLKAEGSIVKPERLLANNEDDTDLASDICVVCDVNELSPTKLIHIMHRINFLFDASAANKAVREVSDPRSRFLEDWRGPMIAYGMAPVEDAREALELQDLCPSDLQPIIDWLNTYRFWTWDKKEYKQLLMNVMGVRVTGENEGAKYDSSAVRGYDHIFGEKPLDFSVGIQLPVHQGRVPSCNYPAPANTTGTDEAANMMIRKDMKPLLPDHAKALSDYHVALQKMVQDVPRNAMSQKLSKPGTKANFLEFSAQWLVENGKQGLISPYAI